MNDDKFNFLLIGNIKRKHDAHSFVNAEENAYVVIIKRICAMPFGEPNTHLCAEALRCASTSQSSVSPNGTACLRYTLGAMPNVNLSQP
jgi:hypothetical protein